MEEHTQKEWTPSKLTRARKAVDALLGELGLEAYLFSVEPEEDSWAVQIECATLGGWKRTKIHIAGDDLLNMRSDPTLRRRLRGEWAARLRACVAEHA